MKIQARVFSGSALRKLSHLLGVSVQEALGILAFLWNEAETRNVIYAELDEIYDWTQMSPHGHPNINPATLVGALEKTKFIEMDFSEGSYRIKGRKVIQPKENPKNWTVWNCYANLYEKRYGIRPKPSPQEMGLAGIHFKTYGEEVFAIIEFFLSNNKKWYVEKCHSFTVLTVGEVSALRTQMKNGTMITGRDAQRIENRDSNHRAIKEVLKHGR